MHTLAEIQHITGHMAVVTIQQLNALKSIYEHNGIDFPFKVLRYIHITPPAETPACSGIKVSRSQLCNN